ncbi:MAG: hypothetical protein Q9214_005767 [Letrouitia sp. 1 TL-2023]
MGSLRFSEYTDSPTVLLPPQLHSTYPSSYTHFVQYHQNEKPAMQLTSEKRTDNDNSPGLTPLPFVVRKSCKRSYDDSCDEHPALGDRDSSLRDRPRPIHGEGMTLTNPSNGNAMSAASQTGTWLEDKLALQSPQPLSCNPIEDTSLQPSHKIQRRDISLSATGSSNDTSSSSSLDAPEPLVDSLALKLGKGWRRTKSDADSQAAARGWAKFIEKRYALSAAKVLGTVSSGNLLAEASGGYYVFEEDLSKGAFLGPIWENCLDSVNGEGSAISDWGEMLDPIDSPCRIESSCLTNPEGQPADSISTTETVSEANQMELD